MQDNGIGYTIEAAGQVAKVVDDLTQELKSRGYGVLSNIDVKKIIKDKIGEDMDDYTILDVCNPKYAKKALDAHKEAGLILPCKIVVSEDKGKTKVSLYRPTRALMQLGFSDLDSMAAQVEKDLIGALDAVSLQKLMVKNQ
ncbi:MAG: DUF302 domain-containing protein [Thaumarchaeota archaeon]|nr:DUF302 domain-containing protein [Nitrososphaerota archaeon]